MILYGDDCTFTSRIVLNKIKDVEVRVNDLKRKNLNIGDTLIFLKRPEEKDQIKAKVVNLVYFILIILKK